MEELPPCPISDFIRINAQLQEDLPPADTNSYSISMVFDPVVLSLPVSLYRDNSDGFFQSLVEVFCRRLGLSVEEEWKITQNSPLYSPSRCPDLDGLGHQQITTFFHYDQAVPGKDTLFRLCSTAGDEECCTYYENFIHP